MWNANASQWYSHYFGADFWANQMRVQTMHKNVWYTDTHTANWVEEVSDVEIE